MSISIGIIECKKWFNYASWLKSDNIRIIELKITKPVREQLERCNGIVLPGGEDVHPSYYNKPEYEKEFSLTDFNRIRDEFELSILQYATQNNIPILGICRGLQIANVFFNGSLIPDLKKIEKTIHSCQGKEETFHSIGMQEGSLAQSIFEEKWGLVNSNHHQSVDRIGNNLELTAKSEDGVVEGIGHRNHSKSMLLVQWHPERLDPSSPFSYRIKDVFTNEAAKF